MPHLSQATPSSAPRQRRATLPCVPSKPRRTPDPLLLALTRICRDARKAIGLKQVHIGAGADLDQSTIARFERAGGWPRDVGRIVNAYAAELGVDPWDIWQQALTQGRNAGSSNGSQ